MENMVNFQLKRWDFSYIDSIAKYADNKKIADNLRNVFPFPYTKEDAERYINNCISEGEKNQITRALVINDEAVGSIGIFVKDDVYCKSAELGYWLAEEYWNLGIMSKAISLLCREAFSQYDIIRIYAEPFSHNFGSRRALEKSGFILEGIMKNGIFKNGNIYDYCMYAFLR